MPTYAFTTPSTTQNQTEGTSLTFTVTTSGVSNGTELYWAAFSLGGADVYDVVDPSPPLGSTTVNSNQATITVIASQDWLTPESGEGYYLRLYVSASDRNSFINHVAESVSITLIDVPPGNQADLTANLSTYISTSQTSFNDINTLTTGEVTWSGAGSTINVTTYGAVGNGVTDCTASIITALGNVSSYGTLYFPAGTYIVTNQLSLPSNIRILGDPTGLTVIKLGAGMAAATHMFINSTYNGVAGTYTQTDICFENIVLDGNLNASRTGYLLGLAQVNGVKIIKCGFINHTNVTMALLGCKNVDIWGSKFAVCGIPLPNTVSSPALFVGGSGNFAGACTYVRINRCVFRNNKWSGIYFFPINGSVQNCLFVNNGESSIFVNETAQNTTYLNNYIYGATRTNISASGLELGGSNVVARNNFLINNGSDGISLTNVKRALVEGNTIYNNAQEVAYASFANASGVGIYTIQSTTEFAELVTVRYNRIYNSSGTTPQQGGVLFYKNLTNLVETTEISNNNIFNHAQGSFININGNSYNPATVTFVNNISNSGVISGGATVVSTVNTFVASASASYSVASNTVSISEGSSVTFTITTSNVPDGTTLFWTNAGTTVAADYVGTINTGSFTISGNNGSVSLTALSDGSAEGTETLIFQVRLLSTGGTVVATASTVNISDAGGATYAVAPSTPTVVEGAAVTYTITTTGVVNGTTLYWTNAGTTVAADFSGGVNSGSFVINSNSGSVVLTLVSDGTNESGETIILQIRTTSVAGPIVATASTVNVVDPTVSTFPASTSSLVTATNYNELVSRVDLVSGLNDFAYGRRDLLGIPVTTGTRVTRLQWINLIADINKINTHQRNAKLISLNEFAATPTTATWQMNTLTSISTVSYMSLPGFLFDAAGINAVNTAVNVISTNTYTVHSTQLTSLASNGLRSTSTVFTNTGISQVIQAKWPNSSTAKYFFNLGGAIQLAVTCTGSTSTQEDVVIQQLLARVSTLTSVTSFGRNNYLTTPTNTGTWTTYAFSGTYNYVRVRVETYKTETSVLMALSITNTSTSVVNYTTPNNSNWNNPVFL